MSDVARHILEIVLVVVAMVALVTMVTFLTKTNANEDGSIDGGMVTNKVNETIENVFDKTDDVLQDETK